MNLNPQDFLVHDISHHPMVVFRNDSARPGYAKQWEVETVSLIGQGAPSSLCMTSFGAMKITRIASIGHFGSSRTRQT